MTKRGFKILLYPSMAEKYEYRHNELQLKMKEMIRQHGRKNYSISPDKETNILCGYLEVEGETLWTGSADTPINRKWWDYMADTMETNRGNSPICVDFQPVFHLD